MYIVQLREQILIKKQMVNSHELLHQFCYL